MAVNRNRTETPVLRSLAGPSKLQLHIPSRGGLSKTLKNKNPLKKMSRGQRHRSHVDVGSRVMTCVDNMSDILTDMHMTLR